MKTAQSDSNKKATIRFLAFVSGFIVVFHCLFFWLVSSGKIMDLLKNTKRPELQVQRQLWNLTHKHSKHDSLFIGDEVFIQKMKDQNTDCDCGYIAVPYYQFPNIGEVLRVIKKNQFQNIFIQNEVRFWTNFNHTDSDFYLGQNTDLLSAHIRNKAFANVWKIFGERLTFDLLKQLLEPSKPNIALEEKYLDPLWFRINPKRSEAVRKSIRYLTTTHFYWVTDTSLTFKNQTGLREKFDDFAKSHDLDIGQMIRADKVHETIKGK